MKSNEAKGTAIDYDDQIITIKIHHSNEPSGD